MPRITKVYTRTGDKGTTRLGSGREVPKEDLRIAAFGTVDELNSCLGTALAAGLAELLAGFLGRIQNDLFHLGSDLCVPEEDKSRIPVPRIEQRHIDELEKWIDRLTGELGPLENFILPGGSAGAAHLHVARSVCRRAERILAGLSRKEKISPHSLAYLNRLSDALFVMARFENHARSVGDIYWDSRS